MGSLRGKMTAAVVSMAFISVLSMGLAVRFGARQGFELYKRLVSEEPGGNMPRAIEAVREGLGASSLDKALAAASKHLSEREVLFVLSPEGEFLGQVGRPLERYDETSVTRNQEGIFFEGKTGAGEPPNRINLNFKQAGLSLRLADGREAEAYLVRFPPLEPEMPERTFFFSIDLWILGCIAIISLIVLTMTLLLARRLFRPLFDLGSAARDWAGGRLDRRVPIRGNDEVADLARNFNFMASELWRQQELRRDLVRDVVHELRTPLTDLRCRLETLIDGMAKDPAKALSAANEDLSHLAGIVEDLQILAQAEARDLVFVKKRVYLLPLAESALITAGLEGDPRLKLDIAPGLEIEADGARIKQVLVNLLVNASRYAPPEGMIEVRATESSGEMLIEVSNTGSSLTEEQAARVFDRFYRVDPARGRGTGGSGLGLAIVRNFVEAQGGRTWAIGGESKASFFFALPLPH